MSDTAASRISPISVVIPALNADRYLLDLLRSIEAQTLLPDEIVIVDSSASGATAQIAADWKGPIPIVCKRVDFAYPGHARNVGVELAKNDWIAFLDCRTLPNRDWLETSASVAEQTGAGFVAALCTYDADTHFQQILRAATYGFDTMRTLPGSIILKSVFARTGGFAPNVRAGEDLEWLDRLEFVDAKLARVAAPTIRYKGFVDSLSKAISKWSVYAIANAAIEVRNNHKKLYLLIFVCGILLIAYRWNYYSYVSGYGNTYYLPNVTKISMALIFSAYFAYRGILRPLQMKVKASYLFPWRWIEVGFVGLCLDLAKAPGLLWGAVLLLHRRISGPPGFNRSSNGQK